MIFIRQSVLLSTVLASLNPGRLKSVAKKRKYSRGRLAAGPGRGAATLAALFLFAGLLCAQIETGTIAGQVKDTSGAAMANVNVEASSPALIEKTRAVLTDAQGLYKIIDLRPGTYTVRFTAPGF